jgi:hypothetical protein
MPQSGILEEIKTRSSLLVQSDEFSIDHRVIRQAGKIRSNIWESLGQVGAAP